VPPALPPRDFFLSAGQSKAEAFEAIDRSTWRGIGLILASFFAAICVAWAGGRKFVRRLGPGSFKHTGEWRIGYYDARTPSGAKTVNAVQSSSDEKQIPIARPSHVQTQENGDPGFRDTTPNLMPNDPNEQGREYRCAEDDPKRGFRYVCRHRHPRELAGEGFEIAFEQSEVGSRLACHNARMLWSSIYPLCQKAVTQSLGLPRGSNQIAARCWRL
jgi:hypothetical protein